MQNTGNKKTFTLLFFSFLIFYSIQIPLHTSKPDIIVFATRSLSPTPILDYAYLAPSTLLEGTALPNYHLGHTLVLWLMYKIFPENIANTLWPAGFVSAISGALIVALTFLIWLQLGIERKKAVVIAIVTGLVPSIWEESIIGEVYALQLMSVLLFLYAFLKDKIILSAAAFAFANMVSPLSALAFGLLFLKPQKKNTVRNIITIGLLSFAIYFAVYTAIGSNLLNLLNPLSEEQQGRGFAYRLATLIVFIIINFNFFLFYLYKGFKDALENYNSLFKKLLLATLPQLLLLFLGSTFFIELGSFQLPIFWALAFPLGVHLSRIEYRRITFAAALTATVVLTYTMWILPNTTLGSAREEAGKWLKQNGYENVCIIGGWNSAISIINGRNGFSLQELNKYYFDEPNPTEEKILETKEDSLIIVQQKKIPLRILLSKLKIPGMNITSYNPKDKIKTGKINKLYENDVVLLYKWKK